MNDEVEHRDIDVAAVDDEAQAVPIFSQLAVLVVVLVLLLGAGVAPHIIERLTPEEPTTAIAQTLPALQPTPPTTEHFDALTLGAEAVMVWDVASQRLLFARNQDEQLPLASITKLMTALLADELLTSTSTITISQSAINQDGTSGFLIEEQFSLASLSDLILLTSSNDGAYAVAETLGSYFDETAPAEAFIAVMNIRAAELGLSQTFFRNPTGLDVSPTEAGAYGSARDVAILTEHILRTNPGLIEATAEPAHTIISENGLVHSARNTNQSVSDISGIIGSKTGFTTLAGGNLVIAFDAGVNRPVIAVVLGSTWQGRFDDIAALVEATRATLN
jgi:D-alanyl-D-alanine carboxypeptidase (penicillin-binding protein 5/6)